MRTSHGYGLFEVFTQEWQDSTPLHMHEGNDVIVQSIQDHLSRLLNARQGALFYRPDYGLPDITEAYGDLPYTIGSLQTAIERCIKNYEPRIVDVEVVSLPQDRAKGVVIMEIRARLANGQEARFETYLKSEGYAKIIHTPVHD